VMIRDLVCDEAINGGRDGFAFALNGVGSDFVNF